MGQGNLLANGQTQSSTMVTPVFTAPESIEQQGELSGIDTWAPIAHRDRIPADFHVDRGSLGCVLNGILQKIPQQGEQGCSISLPLHTISCRGYAGADTRCLGQALQVADGFVCRWRGKVWKDNCQAAVSVGLACQSGSLLVARQLHLPQEWADDPVRREKAGIPSDLQFAPRGQIALGSIRRLMAPRYSKPKGRSLHSRRADAALVARGPIDGNSVPWPAFVLKTPGPDLRRR